MARKTVSIRNLSNVYVWSPLNQTRLGYICGKMAGIIHNLAFEQNKQLQSLLIFLKIEIALGFLVLTTVCRFIPLYNLARISLLIAKQHRIQRITNHFSMTEWKRLSLLVRQLPGFART